MKKMLVGFCLLVIFTLSPGAKNVAPADIKMATIKIVNNNTGTTIDIAIPFLILTG